MLSPLPRRSGWAYFFAHSSISQKSALGHVDLTLGHFDLGTPPPSRSSFDVSRSAAIWASSHRASDAVCTERWPPARLVRYFGAAVISISVEGRATSLAHAHCGAGAASAQRAAKRWFSLRPDIEGFVRLRMLRYEQRQGADGEDDRNRVGRCLGSKRCRVGEPGAMCADER